MRCIAKKNKISKKQEKVYFSLAIAIILVSLIINITNFSETRVHFLISEEISFSIKKDSEKIKEGLDIITGYVAKEVYSFGLPSPIESTITSTSSTSTTAENEFNIIPKPEEVAYTTSSSSSTTIEKTITIKEISRTNPSNLDSVNIIDTSTLSVKNLSDFELLLVKNSALEKYLFYNFSYSKQNTDLLLNFNVNSTVYNFLENCYLTQTVQCCNTIKTYIEDDYPTATCRQINDTLSDYIEGGWHLFQNAIDREIINVTKNYVTITIPNINHLDRIKLGNHTLVYEYQDIKLINYQDSWFDSNIKLYVNYSTGVDKNLGAYWQTSNDIWIKTTGETNKFGANYTSTNETTYFLYQINSTVPILKKDSFTYYLEKTETNAQGGIFNQKHKIDFGDICAVELTLNESEDIIASFNPQCNFKLYNNQVDKDGILITEYLLNVTFYANYDSTKGIIDIDPTISVDTTTSSQAIDSNITREANFNHLTLNDSSLILYTPFDIKNKTNVVYDYSINSFDGSIINDVMWMPNSGFLGGAYSFDGNGDRISIGTPGNSLLNITGRNVTFSVWANWTGVGYSRGIFMYATPTNLNTGIGTSNSANDGKFRFFRYDGTTQRTITCSTIPNANTWYHVAGVFNGTADLIYLNGALCAQASRSDNTFDYSASTVNVGIHRQGTADESFNGTIDEVMLFDRTLSDQEVLDLYNNQSARFYTQGKQEFTIINMTADQTHDRANITYYGQNLSGSYLQSRLGQWNITYGYNNTDTGLVGYWHFDNLSSYGENDTYVVDFAMNQYKNNGTFVGLGTGVLVNSSGPTNSSDIELGLSKFGGDWKFDGNGDYVSSPFTQSLNLTSINFTLSAWARSNVAGSQYTEPIFVVDIGSYALNGAGIILDGQWNSGKYTIYYNSSGDDRAKSTTVVNANIWNHIVGTFNGTALSIYVNGVLENSISKTPGNINNNPLRIGSQSSILQRYFNGTIDEVAIWNRSLSAEEIKSLYIKGRLNYDFTTPINGTQQTVEVNGNTTYIDTHTLNVTNLTQLIPEIWYFAGNGSYNPFYSPVLIGNFTVTTFQTVTITTTTTTTTSSTSSSTLPHANLTLYLRNSTGVELYKNITALTNESINITSSFPYPADVNMTLFVMDYAGINQSRNISKSFLQNFTTFWTTGSFLINISWEGNLTMFGNSTAFWVDVNPTTTTSSSTSSSSTSSTSTTLPKANLTLYLTNSSFSGLYQNITAFTNASINITSKEPYPSDVNFTLYVTNYVGVNISFNHSKSFLQNFTNFWTPGDYLINITWEGNLTLQPNSTAFYVTVLATTTTSSTSSTTSSTTTSTTLPKGYFPLYLRNATAEVFNRNITIETNQTLNITSKDLVPGDANITLFVQNYTGGTINFNYSKSFLQNLTNFWTNGSFLINVSWEGNLTFTQNSTAFYVDVNPTSTTSSTSSTTTSSTTPSDDGEEPSSGGGSSSSPDTNAIGNGKTVVSNIEHNAKETIYTFSEIGTAEPINIQVLDPYMLVTELVIEINRPTKNAKVKITKTTLPKPIPNTNKILEVFQVIHENLPNSFINKVIFTFKIPKDTENMALFKYNKDSKTWNEIQMLKTGEEKLTQRDLDSYSEKIEVEAGREPGKKEENNKNQDNSYDYYKSDLDSLSIFAIAVKKEETKLLSIKPIINRLSELKVIGNSYLNSALFVIIFLIITSLFYLILRILKRAKFLVRIISNVLICIIPLLIIYFFFTIEFETFIFGVLPTVIFSLTVLLIILAVLFKKR